MCNFLNPRIVIFGNSIQKVYRKTNIPDNHKVLIPKKIHQKMVKK